MQILERESQLRAISQYAAEAATGSGRLVLVSGEAGVGKSTLLEECRSRLPATRWAAGSCDGLFIPRPLGPLFDIAEQLGGELLAGCQTGAAREQLFSALLHDLTAEPTVVVIEDIHWADESTLDLLGYLGRRIERTPTLLLVSYRNDDLGPTHPLRQVLGELSGRRAVRRVDLGPLSPQAVDQLAAGSGFSSAEIVRLSGGNPFFVTELLNTGPDGLPPSARDSVLARVARLSDEARTAVETASLMSSLVDVTVLDATSASLDELVRSGLLVSDDGGLRFRHELTRIAVANEVASHRHTEIHARLLDALIERNADEARLAYHAEGAGDAAAVLRFAPTAAVTAAELGAHRESAEQYARALRFASEHDARQLAELHTALGDQLILIDDWEGAAATLEKALRLWSAINEPLREGDVMRLLSRAMWRQGRGREFDTLSQQAIDLLEPLGESEELARAISARAFAEETAHGSTAAIALCTRAIEMAEKLDLPDVLSDALNNRGCMLGNLGEPWENDMERSVEIAVAGGLHDQAGRAFANLQVMLGEARRYDEADKVYEEGDAYCEQHDISTYTFCLRGGHIDTLLGRSQLDETIAEARDLLTNPVMSGSNRFGPWIALGLSLARQGDADSARELLDQAVAYADSIEDPSWLVAAYTGRAEAGWLRGDEGPARDDLEAVLPIVAAVSPWTAGITVTWAARLSLDPAVYPRDLPAGYALMLQGEFAKAADTWDQLGCPYDSALALFDSRTEDGLRAAVRRFDELGASSAARIARNVMRSLGMAAVPAGLRQTTKMHPAGLTVREAEVYGLICAGMSNDQIAQELVISPRTVHHHVSAVLAKLGVSSRHEAARAALDLGDVPVSVPST